MFVFLFEKKKLLLFDKKRTSASKSIMLTLYATGMSGLSCALRGYVGS